MGIVVYVLVGLFIGGCDFETRSNTTPTPKTAPINLSFADDEPLVLEEAKLFDLSINIGEFKEADLVRKYPGNLPDSDRYQTPNLSLAVGLDNSDSRVGGGMRSEFYRSMSCLMGFSSSARIVFVSEGDSEAKFTSIYVRRYPKENIQCDSGCVLSVSLFIEHGCGGGGACDSDKITTIKRPVTIKPTSYALEITKVSDTDVKITATKDGSPLPNAEMKVDAIQLNTRLLHFSPDPNCFAPTIYDSNKPVTTDADGTRIITLAPIEERDKNLKIDVCRADFAITIDGRHFTGLGVSNCD